MKAEFVESLSENSLKERRTSQANVLVAGGAGFIGSHLCRHLLLNCQVFCLDNLVKGKRENIEPFFENENFVFIEHDLKQRLASDFPKVDYIFHLAGVMGYPRDEAMALETLLVNSLGTQHLLELAKKCKAKFLLASSFRVYEGTISKETLRNYFGESKLAESRFSHREAKRFSENLCFEYFKKWDLNTRIVRLADVYGPGMPLDSEEELSLIFKSLVQAEALQIKGSGEGVIYPTFIDDIIQGLLKAMFTQSSRGRIFTLINPRKLTLNEAVHKIEEIVTESEKTTKVKIEFVPQEMPSSFQAPEETIIRGQEDLGWQAKVDFEEGVEKTLSELKLVVAHTPSGEQKKTFKERFKEKKKKKIIPKFQWRLPSFKLKSHKLRFPTGILTLKKHLSLLSLALFFLLIIISPFLFFSSHTFFGFKKLQTSYTSLQKGEAETGHKQAYQAGFHFKKARGMLLQLNFLLQPISKKGVSRVNELLSLGENLSEVLDKGSQAIEKQKEFLNLVLQKKSGHPQEVLDELKLDLEATLESLARTQAQMESGLKPLFNLTTFSLGENLQKLSQELPSRKKELKKLRDLSLIFPEMLGFKEKKTYLLVFQNNMELRPTGGFIGSYGLLVFDKGKLLDFEVQDIYVADGQLKGHVEPPAELKRFLGEANWYFRDANWDPDWTKAAPRLKWFLEKEMKRKVDGVIGLNLTVTQEILTVTGPVAMPDYQETITDSNLFERAEYYSEIDFFPGSTQKKDFLGELSRQMMIVIKNLEGEKFLKLAKIFPKLLQEKQLLLYFDHQSLAEFTRENFWDGSLRKIDYTQQDKGLQDFLMLVEANLGVNKANFFLEREVSHKLKLSKELKVQAETLISYQNNSPGESWPGGIYKNYLRVYLPTTAQAVKVMLKKEGGKFTPLASTKVKEERVSDKKIVGFYFEVPVKEKMEVKLLYSLGELAIKNNQGVLAFYFQKQPGIIDDPLNFEIDHPAYLLTLKTEPEIDIGSQNLRFETDQREDRLFTIYFFKK